MYVENFTEPQVLWLGAKNFEGLLVSNGRQYHSIDYRKFD